MNFYEKLNRFQGLIALNKRATTNTVHISLNFGLNENLEREKLAEIALADRGKEDGIIYKSRGLIYRVLDDKGDKIRVPIKASSIYNKPTLNYLEKRFMEN